MKNLLQLFVLCLVLIGFSRSASAEIWTYQGDSIHYRVAGQGAPVLQVHGLGAGASSEQVTAQEPALVAAGYTVYSIDLTGWGESIGPRRLFTGPYYRDMLLAFIQQVIGAPTAMVGHSLGATYAIAVAAAAPDWVPALVLDAPVGVDSFNQAADLESAHRWKAFIASAGGQSLYAALGSWPSLRGFCLTTLYEDPSYCDAETVQDYWQYTQVPESIYAAAAFLTGNLGLDIRDDFASLSMPVSLVWGAENSLSPLAQSQDFLALNPAATLTVIESAGPLVNEEQQDAFDTVMLQTLSGN